MTGFTHDTLVFIAITWRLMMNSYDEEIVAGNASGRTQRRGALRRKWKEFVWGNNLPRLTNSILKDGQMYYM